MTQYKIAPYYPRATNLVSCHLYHLYLDQAVYDLTFRNEEEQVDPQLGFELIYSY